MEKENGSQVTLSRIAMSMMEITNTTRKMASEYSLGPVEISTKGIIPKMKGMEMAKCFGLTVVCTKENGLEEYNMA
jgi:hypothetical protein